MTGTPGPLWPWHGSGPAGGLALAATLALLVALVPGGWYVLRRCFGRDVAGPVWPLLAFVAVGLTYALVVPPWQMPDEPQHMVHVEVVRRGGFGAADKLLPLKSPPAGLARINADVEHQIVASMREAHATRWLPWARGSLAAGVVPGPTELPHPPLYYDVAAVLLRPFGGMPVVARVAILRVLGVALAAVVVWCCGAAGRLVFKRRSWAEATAAIAVAVPSFALFAGAVNNDALAQPLAALLLLVLLVGVLEAGPLARPLPWLGVVVVLFALGGLTKGTFLPLIPVVVVALGVRARHHPRLVATAIGAVALVVVRVVVAGAGPRLAGWHRATTTGAARCRGGHGDAWAICLTPSSYQVSQKVPLVDANKVANADVRADAWVRGAGAAFSLDLNTDNRLVAHAEQEATSEWQHVVATGHVPRRPGYVSLALTAKGPGTVAIDDVRLSPLDPVAATDFVANGSGRSAVPSAPSALPGPLRRAVDGGVDAVDRALQQPGAVVDSSGLVARRAAQGFGSFWGTVGWPPMPLFPVGLQWAIAVLVVAGAVGFILLLVRRQFPLTAAAVVIAAVLSVGVAAAVRAIPPTEVEAISARYLFPAMVAFTVVLAAGWRCVWPWSGVGFRNAVRVSIPVMHALFIGLLVVPFVWK